MSNGGDFDIDARQEEWERSQMKEAGLADDGKVVFVCHICDSLDNLKECNECHQHACPEHFWEGEGCCLECSADNDQAYKL